MPTVSVIIPSHNRSSLITRAIDSVLQQTRAADEVIVVDDGSNDNTATLLSRDYPQVRLLRHNNNQGVSAARNLGIRHATNDWIALLDSDDVWREDKLQRQFAALKTKPDYRVCHTDEQWLRHGIRITSNKKYQKYGGPIFQHCLPRCAISPSSVVIHRSVFERVGLFDEELPACEDYDLWLRITAVYPVLCVDEKLVTRHGGHSDQLSRRYFGMDRFRIRALAKILAQDHLDSDDRKAAISTMLKKIRIYLNGAAKYGNTECVTTFKQLQVIYSVREGQ